MCELKRQRIISNLLKGNSKRDLIIDQQKARHFVQYTEWLSNPPSPSMQLK